MARPTDYTEALQDAADGYVNGGHEACDDLVPSIAGLACELHASRSTIYLWAEKYPAFSDTLERLKFRQERLLLSGALSGQHNATIAKLMLCNHGYSDKQSQEISGPNGEAIKTESKVEWTIQPVKPINEADS